MHENHAQYWDWVLLNEYVFFFVNYYVYYYRREAVPVWRHRMWSQILSLRPAKEAPASTHRYDSLSRPEPGKLETILELLTAVTVIYRAHTQLCRAAWLAVLGEPLSAGMVSSTPAEDKAVTDQRWMDESAVSVNLAPSLSSLLCKWISSSLLRERKKMHYLCNNSDLSKSSTSAPWWWCHWLQQI